MDNDGLIDITTLEQLDAIRYDLDGDGAVATADEANYGAAFPTTAGGSTYGAIGCGDGATITACSGYELMESLDFEDEDSYAGSRNDAWVAPDNGGTTGTEGWLPIGDNSNNFTAVFEGNDHTISNLYINSSVRNVGLFGYLGTGAEVRNVGIEGGSVTTSAAYGSAGGLVGWNYQGTISGCYATGAADTTGDYARAGGLVGWNARGTITSSYATGAADATGTVWLCRRPGGAQSGHHKWLLCHRNSNR